MVLHVGLFLKKVAFVLLTLSVEGFHLIPVVFLGPGRELRKHKDHDSFHLQITGHQELLGHPTL